MRRSIKSRLEKFESLCKLPRKYMIKIRLTDLNGNVFERAR